MDPTVNGIAKRVAEMIPANRGSIGPDSFRALARHLPHLAESIESHDLKAAAKSVAPSIDMPELPTAAVPFDHVPRPSGKAMAGMARQMVAMQSVANATRAATQQSQQDYEEALDSLPDRELAAKKPLPPPDTPADLEKHETAKRRLALVLSRVGKHPRFRAELEEYGILKELSLKNLRTKTLEKLRELQKEVRDVLNHAESPSIWHYLIDYGSRAVEKASIPAFKAFQMTPLTGFHAAVMADEDLSRLKDLVSLESDDFVAQDPRFGMATRTFEIAKGIYDRNTELLKKQLQAVPVGDLESKYADLDN